MFYCFIEIILFIQMLLIVFELVFCSDCCSGLESEEQHKGHHKAKQTHGLRQSETQNGVREQLLLQSWVSGIADHQTSENSSDSSAFKFNIFSSVFLKQDKSKSANSYRHRRLRRWQLQHRCIWQLSQCLCGWRLSGSICFGFQHSFKIKKSL